MFDALPVVINNGGTLKEKKGTLIDVIKNDDGIMCGIVILNDSGYIKVLKLSFIRVDDSYLEKNKINFNDKEPKRKSIYSVFRRIND